MRLAILSTQAGNPLANKIASELDVPLTPVDHRRFGDGEYLPQIMEHIRDAHLVLIAPVQPPSDRNLMDMMILGDAIVRSSPTRFTIVLPYLGYNRQDRKDKPHVPLTASIPADMITWLDPDNVLFFDLHSEATVGFIPRRIKSDHLYGSMVAINKLKKLVKSPFVIASPDEGGGKRAAIYARLMGKPGYVVVEKCRDSDGQVIPGQSMVVGDVRGKRVIIIDDMLDSGGTANQAAKTLLQEGALEIYFFATHGILSGNAVEKLNNGPMAKILITDSISHDESKLGSKIEVLSCAPLLADAIQRVHNGNSLSELINK